MINTIGYVYKKTAHKELPIVEELDERDRKKLSFMLRKLEEEAESIEARDHRNGYCPRCHMLIPTGRTHCECED